MIKAGVISILLIITCLCIYGQTPVRISGVIRDANGVGLSKATVQLSGDMDTAKGLSGDEGIFLLYIRQGEAFHLRISMQGYKIYETRFIIDSGRLFLVLPPIVLLNEFEDLAPVMVLGVKPVTLLEDTVEYRAAAYQLRAGAAFERLMKQLPGIDWDTGGNVLVKGKKIDRIMINGQDFSGGDIKTALQNLPADIIDKVQVIDDYGNKAKLTGVKSGESEKVLNIILKKDKQNGSLAKVEAGDGDQDKYIGELFSSNFKGGRQIYLNIKTENTSVEGNHYQNLIDLGYNQKMNPKFLISGNIKFSEDKLSSVNNITQDSYFSGSQIHQEQNNKTHLEYGYKSIGYSMKYTPNSNTNFRFASYLQSLLDLKTLSDSFYTLEHDTTSTESINGNSVNISTRQKLLSRSEFYFDKTYPYSKNRISFEGSYEYSSDKIYQNDENYSMNIIDSMNHYSFQHDLINLSSFSKELMVKMNYYYSLGKFSLFDVGYFYDWLAATNDQTTQSPDSILGQLTKIDSLSANYTYALGIQRLHVGYLNHSEKLNLNLGLDFQSGSQNSQILNKEQPHYRNLNVLPHVEASYILSPCNKINFEYRGISTLPTPQELNPTEDYSNPQYPVEGNPNLKPSFTQSASLRYEHSSVHSSQYTSFGLGLSYELSTDAVIVNLLHPKNLSSIVQSTFYTNANGFNSGKIIYHWDLPSLLSNHIRILVSGSLDAANVPVMTDNILYGTSILNWTQGMQIKFNYPKVIESMLSGNYCHSLTRYPYSEFSRVNVSSFIWQCISRHDLLNKWTLTYDLSQNLTSESAGTLKVNPILINASVEREIFRYNQGKLRLTVTNILNESSNIAQITTSTGIIQTRTNLTGRFFLLSITIKLEKFR